MLTYISFTDSVDTFMMCLYKGISMPNSNSSLVTAIKLEAKYGFHATVVLFYILQGGYLPPVPRYGLWSLCWLSPFLFSQLRWQWDVSKNTGWMLLTHLQRLLYIWGITFSWWWTWRLQFSGIWGHIVWYKGTSISEKFAATNFRVEETFLHSRRPQSLLYLSELLHKTQGP
jgi:hypothetical protein